MHQKDRRQKPYCRLTFRQAELTKQKDLVENLLQQLDVTAFGQVNVIVCNELFSAYEDHESALDIWPAFARKLGCYVIPGTYYCKHTFHAIAPIIKPSGSVGEEHMKLTSAFRVEESIRTPDVIEVAKYWANFGYFSVLVCFDLYNPSIILKLMSMNCRLSGTSASPDREIRLICIPSCNNDDPISLSTFVRHLARYANTAVVMPNTAPGTKGRERRIECYASAYGVDLTPLKSASLDGGVAYLYEIDTDAAGVIESSSTFQSLLRGNFTPDRL